MGSSRCPKLGVKMKNKNSQMSVDRQTYSSRSSSSSSSSGGGGGGSSPAKSVQNRSCGTALVAASTVFLALVCSLQPPLRLCLFQLRLLLQLLGGFGGFGCFGCFAALQRPGRAALLLLSLCLNRSLTPGMTVKSCTWIIVLLRQETIRTNAWQPLIADSAAVQFNKGSQLQRALAQ